MSSKYVRKFLSLGHSKSYLVAGIPRCGTTLIWAAIASRISVYTYTDFVVDLKNFSPQRGHLYKTHDFPEQLLNSDPVKVIFMFGNPMDSALSASKAFVGREQKACEHQHSFQYGSPDQVFEYDLYRLEENFDRWYQPQSFEFCSIRYEALYEGGVEERLRDFLQLDVSLPPQVVRKSSAKEHPRYKELAEIYGNLERKVNDAEDFKVWKRK